MNTKFQQRVKAWVQMCLGKGAAQDVQHRSHRFLEEALELVQSTGCTAGEAHQLVDYVFNRPVGEPHQEAGGVSITLTALCNAVEIDLGKAAEDELARVNSPEIIAKVRKKNQTKPESSPLPGVC